MPRGNMLSLNCRASEQHSSDRFLVVGCALKKRLQQSEELLKRDFLMLSKEGMGDVPFDGIRDVIRKMVVAQIARVTGMPGAAARVFLKLK